MLFFTEESPLMNLKSIYCFLHALKMPFSIDCICARSNWKDVAIRHVFSTSRSSVRRPPNRRRKQANQLSSVGTFESLDHAPPAVRSSKSFWGRLSVTHTSAAPRRILAGNIIWGLLQHCPVLTWNELAFKKDKRHQSPRR